MFCGRKGSANREKHKIKNEVFDFYFRIIEDSPPSPSAKKVKRL
jgi:hypothetical protein